MLFFKTELYGLSPAALISSSAHHCFYSFRLETTSITVNSNGFAYFQASSARLSATCFLQYCLDSITLQHRSLSSVTRFTDFRYHCSQDHGFMLRIFSLHTSSNLADSLKPSVLRQLPLSPAFHHLPLISSQHLRLHPQLPA